MNLQLFAKAKVDPNSIVDYLKSQGQDSSYSARQKIAKELNIQGYNGSGTQNTQMLNMLKNGTTTAKATGKGKAEEKKPSNTTAPEVKPVTPATPVAKAPTVNGVDQSIVDTVNSTFVASDETKDAQAKKGEALEALDAVPTASINEEYLQILNTPYTMSSTVQNAWNVTNAIKEKLLSGRTSYTDQIQSLMNKIQNRDKFSYDVDTDMLFQQALASAMGSGQQAMRDTIGQASALTGGYASSYATSAGNQAYNAYIQDAYNNLPEYYQMALEAYQMEGQDMYNQLSMLNDADATEYGRMLDSYNISYTEANDMYNREYAQYQDTWSNAYNMANLDLEQQGMAYDQAFNTYNVYADYADTSYNNDFNTWAQTTNNASNIMATQNNDYWSQKDEDYRRDALASDEEQARLDRIHDSEESALDRAHDSSEAKLDRDHDSSEAQKDRDHDQSQFNSLYDINGDDKVDYLDKSIEETSKKTEIDQKYFVDALGALNNGGTAKLNEYLNSLSGILDEDALETLADYAGEYGTDPYDAEHPVPYKDRIWDFVDDGGRYVGDLDDDAKVRDQYGNEMTIEALYEQLLKEGMSEKKAKELLVALQDELGI